MSKISPKLDRALDVITWCLGALIAILVLFFFVFGPSFSEIADRVRDEWNHGVTYTGPTLPDPPRAPEAASPQAVSVVSDPSQGVENSLTKDQWKARFGNINYLIAQQFRRPAFERKYGKPSHTQTAGDETYWYYTCSDGEVQLVLVTDYLRNNVVVVTQINDF